MKILFILELYYPNIGGIEKLFKALAEKLVKEGNEVEVITTRFREDLPKSEILNGVKIKRLSISSRFFFTFFGIFGMMKEARQCDIIHTTSYNAAFPARLAGWLTKKKVIITFHEVWGKLWFKLPYQHPLNKRLYYLYEQFILRLGFHRYIAVSDFTARCLKENGINEKKIVRIYNGLDYDHYKSENYLKPQNFVATYFGRLGSSKGLDLIMEAVPSFLEKHSDAHLKMIIPKVPTAFYKKIMKQLAVIPKERYTLMHNLNIEDLYHQLQNSTCVIIPSYSEGFCFAAAECIALGVPLISSGQGALKEVVSGDYIVMDSQDKKGLYDALEKAYQGEWIENSVKEFHFTDTVKEYLDLYAEGY